MDDIIGKANHYWRAAGRTGLAHYKAAEIAANRHKKIGIPNVLLSAGVATSVFSTLSDTADPRIKVLTGIVALAVAMLAALQAFLNYGDRAEKHKMAGAKYGMVRRHIDLFVLEISADPPPERAAALEKLKKIADEMNSLATDSPTLADAVYNAARKEFDNSQKATGE